jgi:hypothetical protein
MCKWCISMIEHSYIVFRSQNIFVIYASASKSFICAAFGSAVRSFRSTSVYLGAGHKTLRPIDYWPNRPI